MMTKRVVKTPGQRLHQHAYDRGKVLTKWNDLTFLSKQDYESDAADLGIQPLTEEVPDPPKTDGELMLQATDNCSGHVFLTSEADDIAAEFLRLRAERDAAKSEPLEVTRSQIEDWESDYMIKEPKTEPRESYLAKQINAHRGVRPVPKVTAKMCREAVHVCWKNIPDYSPSDMADYLNDKLAEGK